jgi:hypothetical protein
MPENYINRTVGTRCPGFSDLRNFFMKDSPGGVGAMLGKNPKFELPTDAFLKKIEEGFADEDAAALHFLYKSVADLTGCKQIIVRYDREGYPIAGFKGNSFPHSKVELSMPFFMNSKMTWRGWVTSDRLLLPSKYSNLERLKKIITNSKIEVEEYDFYKENAENPDIYEQLQKYPDLLGVVYNDLFLGKKENPLKNDLGDLYEQDSIHSSITLSPEEEKILKQYRVYKYFTNLNCFTQTLNEIVEEIASLLPNVERAHESAKDTFFTIL